MKGRNYNSSRYSFKANRPKCEYNQGDYAYVPLSKFCKENYLSRSQVYRLMRLCRVYTMTHKAKIYVKWIDPTIRNYGC